MTYPDFAPQWLADAEVAASGGDTFDKRCPMDDRLVARVARGGAADARRAVDEASRAADTWSLTPPPLRGAILSRAATLLREREHEFGTIVQTETGKPWKSAVAEVASSADLGVFMGSEGSRFYGKTMPSPILHRTVQTIRQPIGICAALMPFNSPLAGVAWKVFPALVCGNAVVVKSHELTPFTAIAFGHLLKDAGLPSGLYSVLQGLGPEVGAPLVEDNRVGIVSFTGSSATGKQIQKAVSERTVLAKVCLELGGKNPLVVCDDADLENADIESADLKGASLAWANLQQANLRGACLKEADLRWADMRRANLSEADFRGANLAGADLRDAILMGADFRGAKLKNTILEKRNSFSPAALKLRFKNNLKL